LFWDGRVSASLIWDVGIFMTREYGRDRHRGQIPLEPKIGGTGRGCQGSNLRIVPAVEKKGENIGAALFVVHPIFEVSQITQEGSFERGEKEKAGLLLQKTRDRGRSGGFSASQRRRTSNHQARRSVRIDGTIKPLFVSISGNNLRLEAMGRPLLQIHSKKKQQGERGTGSLPKGKG